MKNPLTVCLFTLVGFPFLIIVSLVLQSSFVSHTNDTHTHPISRPIKEVLDMITDTRKAEGQNKEQTHNTWQFNEITNTVTIVNSATNRIETYIVESQDEIIADNRYVAKQYSCRDVVDGVEYQFTVYHNYIAMWTDKYSIDSEYIEFHIAKKY